MLSPRRARLRITQSVPITRPQTRRNWPPTSFVAKSRTVFEKCKRCFLLRFMLPNASFSSTVRLFLTSPCLSRVLDQAASVRSMRQIFEFRVTKHRKQQLRPIERPNFCIFGTAFSCWHAKCCKQRLNKKRKPHDQQNGIAS